MTAKGHLVLGITAPIIFKGATFFLSPMSVIGLILGSLLPDIDEPNSYIGRKFFLLSGPIKAMNILEHRGITHYAIIPLITILIGYIIKVDFLMWLGVGILMHDIGDLLTKGGIDKFFYPFNEDKIGLLPREYRFYTNSYVEYIFILFLIILDLYFLFGMQDARI